MPDDPEREVDRVFVPRHTLMNPWRLADPDARISLEHDRDYLESVVDRGSG